MAIGGPMADQFVRTALTAAPLTIIGRWAVTQVVVPMDDGYW
jgi:hypothetical protein